MTLIDYQQLVDSVLSRKRLQKYGSLSPSKIPETVATYLWNVKLSECFYVPLNGLEVSLRNGVHRALTKKTGFSRWMDPQRNLLRPKELDQVRKAINRLSREGKSTGVDSIISAMTLGFWVGLFSTQYEQRFWVGNSLRVTFPDAARSELGIHRVRARLYRIKYLRNRVFHHEPIWNWDQLETTYADIHTLIEGLSTDWAIAMYTSNEFHSVFSNGPAPFLKHLQTLR